jgi:pimeloyl-ACP methyl ester carboxylesterase
MDATKRLILLPGLGADGRLFDEQRGAFPFLETPEWIPPASDDERLEDYAARFAARLGPDARPTWIGGTSFGGQVALEMAHRMRPRVEGVILIAAPRSRETVTAAFRAQQALGSLAPEALVRRVVPWLAGPFARREGLSAEHAARLRSIAAEVDVGFLRWGARASAAWRRTPTDPVAAPVHHVHGRRDAVIPWREGEPDLLLDDAGHLITFTHASAVNAFVAECLERAA